MAEHLAAEVPELRRLFLAGGRAVLVDHRLPHVPVEAADHAPRVVHLATDGVRRPLERVLAVAARRPRARKPVRAGRESDPDDRAVDDEGACDVAVSFTAAVGALTAEKALLDAVAVLVP